MGHKAESANEGSTASEKSTGDIPAIFLCPITHKIMQEPVFAAFDGQSYEKAAIQEYVAKHKKSPVTGGEATVNMIFPNLALKMRIVAFIESNEIAQEIGDDQNKEGHGETVLL